MYSKRTLKTLANYDNKGYTIRYLCSGNIGLIKGSEKILLIIDDNGDIIRLCFNRIEIEKVVTK